MRRGPTWAVICLCVLASGGAGCADERPEQADRVTKPAPAAAAPELPALPPVTRPAVLKQRPGRQGCLGVNLRHGCGRVPTMLGAAAVAVSPDGRNVYVGTEGKEDWPQSRVIIFKRRPNGALRPLAGRRGCVGDDGRCAPVKRYLANPADIIVSPDGRYVYVAYRGEVWENGRGGQGVGVFARDPGSGRLALVTKVATTLDIDDLELSPTGDVLYGAAGDAGSTDGDAWRRDAVTGELGDAQAMPLGSPLTLDPSGRSLYGTGDDFGFGRARADLGGTDLQGITLPCPRGAGNCEEPLFVGAAISPDGRSLYAIQTLPRPGPPWPGVITASALDENGILVAGAEGACLTGRAAQACSQTKWLANTGFGVTDPVMFDVSNGNLFVTTGEVVAALGHDQQTGELRAGACLGRERMGCSEMRGVRSVRHMALSPDGHTLYVTGHRLAILSVR